MGTGAAVAVGMGVGVDLSVWWEWDTVATASDHTPTTVPPATMASARRA
jgi:hypothetical protein